MTRGRFIRITAALIVAAGCLLLYLYLAVSSGPIRFGAAAVAEPFGSGQLIFGYLMTLLGVLLGTAYRRLQHLRDAGIKEIPSFRRFSRSIFLSIEFWLGICGSPLVYALLVRSTEGGGLAGLTTIAIQNGFFCTVIIAGLAAKPPEVQAAGVASQGTTGGNGNE